MAYGTIKVNNITFDDGGSDQTVTVSGLYNAFTNDIAVTGTISGTTVTGTTANFVSGVFTTQISGTTVTGTTSSFTTGNFTTLSGATATFTSGVIASGTATNPSLSFVGDPNTGIFSPGADQVAVATNGVGRLFVNSTGLVQVNGNLAGGRDLTQFVRLNGDASANYVQGVSLPGNSKPFVIEPDTNSSSLQLRTSTENPILFTTNSSERLRITSAGLVGIGTSSPNVPLEVVGNIHMSGAADRTIFNRANNALSLGTNNTTRLHITNAGNVGIGTTSPAYPLEVARNNGVIGFIPDSVNGNTIRFGGVGGTANQLIFTGASDLERARIDSSGRLLVGTSTSLSVAEESNVQISGTSASLSLARWRATDSGPRIDFAKSRSDTTGTYTIVQNNDQLFIITGAGADGSKWIRAALITAQVDGTPGADDMPGRLMFSVTADGASSPTEALRITNDRVVAYNQATPAAVNATATLTVANLKTGIITSTSAAATDMTLPTGTNTEAGFSGLYTNFTFEWTVINTGPSLVRVLAATAHTIVGSGSVATGTSGRFASRRTAANTFVTYRLS
jgi:hypothetical protein